MYLKRIVCLANSRKSAGRCVAGIEIAPKSQGAWIRPVSSRASQEISEEERRYEDGTDPRVLDIVDVPLHEAQPHGHQSENHVIDDTYYWEKKGIMSWEDLQDLVENDGDTLWENGDRSYYGLNDRMSEANANKFDNSLILIRPENLVILVRVEGEEFNNPRRRVRAKFDWKGTSYLLSVTDPVAERKYLQMDDGEYRVRDAVLCISAGERHTDGKCYKFCAALITSRSRS